MILFYNVSFDMLTKIPSLRKRPVAYFACELLASVSFVMIIKLTGIGKSLIAYFTAVRLLTSVDSVVHF